MGSEGLHPHAGAGDADLAHQMAPLGCQAARIELDRPFGRDQREVGVQGFDQRHEFAWQNRIGAAPAKGDAPHPRGLREQAGDRGKFLMQRREISLHPRAAARCAGVAAAIIADLLAERDVEIERYVALGPCNRTLDRALFKRAEIGGGGIAGVARHRGGEQLWMI
jgi:hypothetical protein